MHASNLPCSKRAIAVFLLTNNPKGMSSRQLAKQVGVTQKTAWFLAHPIH